LLAWSQLDLSGKAGVAKQTLVDFERGARTPYDRTLADIERALADGGVEFIPRTARASACGWRSGRESDDRRMVV
jgi:transcriptional regulator with XRE-family HTH domain